MRRAAAGRRACAPHGPPASAMPVKVKPKTFTENWDSKATSVRTLLAYLETQFQFQLIQTIFISIFSYPLSDWVEILWGFTIFLFKQMLKISALRLEKQKSFIPKKKI